MIELTAQQKADLNDEVDNDPATKGYAAFLPNQPGHVCDLMNALTETLPKERIITSRGIASILGNRAAETFLQSLETFSVADLPADHPLKLDQPGIKRQIAWLSTQGLDLGDPETRKLLDALAATTVVDAGSATALKNAALKPASRCDVRGLPYMTVDLFLTRNS